MHTKKSLFIMAILSSFLNCTAFAADKPAAPVQAPASNILTMAAAYKETAAEYRALYYQGFNIAHQKVAHALAHHKKDDKPLAVITDVDDTILLHGKYWASLIADGGEFFDDPKWDAYIPTNESEAAPGALDFLNFCKKYGVEVFYVTSRDQGEGTYGMALDNLKAKGFPYADQEHLTVLIDTSNKEKTDLKIEEKYNVVVYLGDSLNDYRRKYYVKDVAQRQKLMEEDKAVYGDKFIVMPNPTDGHWIRAIFGESEPADTAANRATWKKAATSAK